jgi:hypothetical protein
MSNYILESLQKEFKFSKGSSYENLVINLKTALKSVKDLEKLFFSENANDKELAKNTINWLIDNIEKELEEEMKKQNLTFLELIDKLLKAKDLNEEELKELFRAKMLINKYIV